MSSIVVCPVTGDRLCKDMKWRSHANFGSYSSCVKIYKRIGNATKAGERYKHPHNKTTYLSLVITLNDGDSMDAAGKVTRANGYQEVA